LFVQIADGVLVLLNIKMIYIFTGDGKGKTTSALGTGLRAIGAGLSVILIRFLKAKGISSEEKSISQLKNFKIKSFGRKGFFVPKEELKRHPEFKKYGVRPFEKIDKELAEKALKEAERAAASKKYNLIILDEINMALYFKLLNKKKVIEFLRKYRESLDIILTGRNCPKGIIKIADLVTEMKEIKHYYQKGIPAKKGIDC